jgi:peptide deformylase
LCAGSRAPAQQPFRNINSNPRIARSRRAWPVPILEFPDPRLRTRADPVTQFDARLSALIDDMFETMYAAPGIGLAATQVDVHQRLIVIDISETKDQREVFINPQILSRSVELTEEGCLSVPQVFEEVERAARVRVRP